MAYLPGYRDPVFFNFCAKTNHLCTAHSVEDISVCVSQGPLVASNKGLGDLKTMEFSALPFNKDGVRVLYTQNVTKCETATGLGFAYTVIDVQCDHHEPIGDVFHVVNEPDCGTYISYGLPS